MKKKKIKRVTKRTGIHECSVCSKPFTHQKHSTLVGRLGIIPVQFCQPCFKKVMKLDEMFLSDSRRVMVG